MFYLVILAGDPGETEVFIKYFWVVAVDYYNAVKLRIILYPGIV